MSGQVPVDTTLTEDERDALVTWNRVEGTTTWLEAETVYAAVERILAQRAAPDPRIEKVRELADEWDDSDSSAACPYADNLRAVLDGDPS